MKAMNAPVLLPDTLSDGVDSPRRATPCACPAGTRIVAAMSGGVDSHGRRPRCWRGAGYDVVGVTLQLYDHGAAIQQKGACCAGQDIHDARTRRRAPSAFRTTSSTTRAASSEQVIEDFADSYRAARRPCPASAAIQTVKFARPAGRGPRPGRRGPGHRPLCRAAMERPAGAELHARPIRRADQSLFPVRHHARSSSTTCASRWALPKPASARRRANWAWRGRQAGQPGHLFRAGGPLHHGRSTACARMARSRATSCTWTAAVLGRHEGVTRYTIGQRRGLNVAVGDPLFVVQDRRRPAPGDRRPARGAADHAR